MLRSLSRSLTFCIARPEREGFMQALDSMKSFDAGGYGVSFTTTAPRSSS